MDPFLILGLHMTPLPHLRQPSLCHLYSSPILDAHSSTSATVGPSLPIALSLSPLPYLLPQPLIPISELHCCLPLTQALSNHSYLTQDAPGFHSGQLHVPAPEAQADTGPPSPFLPPSPVDTSGEG